MHTLDKTHLSPGILSVLPLIYVAWSDSVLSPSEMDVIHNKIDNYDFLSADEKSYLKKWSNPLNPPSDKQFRTWNTAFAKHAIKLDKKQKESLVDLGINIAQVSVSEDDKDLWNSPHTKASLEALKISLGLNESSDELLLMKLDQSSKKDILQSDLDLGRILKQSLDGDHQGIKDRIRKLLRDPFFEIQDIPDKDIYRLRILDQVKKLADQGLSAYSFPKKYGGYEENGTHIAIFEMLGYTDLSLAIKFGVQFGLFGGAVFLLGTEKHHKKYVEKLHKAELLGCFAMTETGHGSNVKNLETTATYNHDTKSLIIHSPRPESGKEYIGNALHSSMAAVFAQLIVDGENHGVHAVLVPLRDSNNDLLPGVTVEDCGYKLGLNGVDNGRIWFDQVEVPVENLLNKYGSVNENGEYESIISNPSKRFFTMLGALVVGRICVGLLGINASKVALSIALKYAHKRRQFGYKDGMQETRIIDYPTHQKRLYPKLAQTYAYYYALRDLSDQYAHAEEDEMREIETLAAGLKSKATWHATQTIQECREACGGKGYLAENRFAALKADSDIFTTFEGDNTVLMQLVAKGLLTEFKQSFHDDGFRAVVRFLYTKAKHEAGEYNVLFTRNTDSDHLKSYEFHLDAFDYRYQKTLISLSERMRKYLKRGIDPYQAFLKVQNHMVDLADSYIDLITLKSFKKHLAAIDNTKAREALNALYNLYALDRIYQNRGFYLEKDYMNGSKSKAILRSINKLYQEIAPHALNYIDAFAIPDELIKAPIALKDFS